MVRNAQSRPKHRQIFEELQSAIVTGRYESGQRIPTEAELGLRYQTSRITVARALRDLEQAGYLVRRRGVGSFVSQTPVERGTLFGLLVPRPSRGVFASICDEIVHQSESNGYGLLLAGGMTPGRDVILSKVEQFCEQAIARKVAGVFFGALEVPPEQMSINVQITDRLQKAGIPVVLLDRDIYDYPMRSPFDLVGSDSRSAERVITSHLLGMGLRRVHFLAPDYTASTISARIAGYQDALRTYGIDPDPAWVNRWDASDRTYVATLMKNSRAEAFVCVNDRLAESFMLNLAVLGIRVPEDVRIVGFDDSELTSHLPVGLTTMRQPTRYIGKMAVKVMLDRVADPHLPPRETLLGCQLIVRESCGAALRRSAQVAAV